MYQLILNALKAKFQGVSDAVLSRIANKLAKTVTSQEQVATSVEGVTLQQVIDSYADHRATEAQQTAVQNYESKYGLKDGEKVTPVTVQQQGGQSNTGGQPTQPTAGGANETPEWAKQLLEQNKTLTERIAKMEGQRTTDSRKQQLQTIVAKLPEKLRKPYERITVDSLTDEQFNTLVTEVTTEVDGIANDFNSKGAVFGRPTANGGGNQGNELTKEQQEAIAHRDGSVKGEGQPF